MSEEKFEALKEKWLALYAVESGSPDYPFDYPELVLYTSLGETMEPGAGYGEFKMAFEGCLRLGSVFRNGRELEPGKGQQVCVFCRKRPAEFGGLSPFCRHCSLLLVASTMTDDRAPMKARRRTASVLLREAVHEDCLFCMGLRDVSSEFLERTKTYRRVYSGLRLVRKSASVPFRRVGFL